MENFLISLQLTRLANVGKVLLKDRNGKQVDCLAIPIDRNFLSVSESNEVYLNAIAWKLDNLREGKRI